MAQPASIQEDAQDAAPDRWLRKGTVDPATRLPVFAQAMHAVAAAWSTSFSGLSASEGAIAFTGLNPLRVEDVPGPGESLPILAGLRLPAWDTMIGFALDRETVSTVVESFFGGEGDDNRDNRPITPIEVRIVDVLGGQVAAALTASLSGAITGRVEFDRTLPKPDPSFLGKPAVALLGAGFTLTTVGRTVRFRLLFPQAAIDARAALWAGESDASVPLDPAGWTRQLHTEVSRAAMRMQASITLGHMGLGALAALRPGQLLELPAGAATQVVLRCGEEALFRCALGQSAGFYTVRVEDALERSAQPPRKER